MNYRKVLTCLAVSLAAMDMSAQSTTLCSSTGRGKRHVMSFAGNLAKVNRSIKNCHDERYKVV